MIQLTLAEHGEPPIALNPGAIVAVKPRKSLRPDVASQSPQVQITWSGSQITLPSGVTFNVIENYDTVLGKVHASMRLDPIKKDDPAKKAPEKVDA
jgi:hypothetical protein